MRIPTVSLPRLRAPLSLLGILGVAASGLAQTPEQESDSLYRETYAIVGARIEVGDGRVIEKGTVLVQDGKIKSVGADVSVPSYAFVVKGEGLTVYPGFIDAYTTKALKLPDPAPEQDVKLDTGQSVPASMREANRKGVRPELNAADYLDLSQANMRPERAGGITAELVAPAGGLLNGRAAFVNVTGRPARESVLIPGFGMVIGFRATGEGYPATPLGFMAQLRQTFLDAQRIMSASQSQDLPLADRSMLALQPVLRGEMPVLLESDRGFEISRALGLADQFSLKPILVGGLEAFQQVPDIKRRGIPVILGLNFAPEPYPKKEPEKGPPAKPEANPSASLKEASKQTDDPTDTPSEVLAERQVKWLDRVRTAKALADQDVLFAFSSRGAKDRNEFWKNLRRAIAEGLDRQAALQALTINPAKIFGVDRQLGTVETGKLANLTIMNGDFAKSDAKVRYVVIGGRLFDIDKDKTVEPPARRRFFGHDDEGPHGQEGVGL